MFSIPPNLIGPAAIMGSNIVFLSNTFLSRSHNASDDARLITFWIANILLATLTFMKPSSINVETNQTSYVDHIAVTIWGLSFTTIYSLLILYPDIVTIPHLILAECLAPILMIPFFKQSSSHSNFRGSLTAPALCLTLLAFITWSIWDSGSTASFETGWPYFALIAVLYTTSQSMARFLSSRRPATWAPIRMSLVASFGIGALVLSRTPIDTLINVLKNYGLWLLAPAMACLSLMNRSFFMVGLKRTSPILAALIINTTLPLSIVFNAFETGKVLKMPLIASISYCAVATLFVYFNVVKKEVGEAIPTVQELPQSDQVGWPDESKKLG